MKDIKNIEAKLNNDFKLVNPKITFNVDYFEVLKKLNITANWNRIGKSINLEQVKNFHCNSEDFQNCLQNEIKPYFLNKKSEFYAKK